MVPRRRVYRRGQTGSDPLEQAESGRVTAICHGDNSTAPFAGICAKPPDGLEPSTPSLPWSDGAGTEGKAGKVRARKRCENEESGEDERPARTRVRALAFPQCPSAKAGGAHVRVRGGPGCGYGFG